MRAIDLLGGTEVISREDCLELLAEQRVGRIGVVVDGQVEIFPVNYAFDGECIVFRTNSGRKLTGVRTGEATFEADELEGSARAGWSVVVHGHTERMPTEPQPGVDLTSEPWTGPKDFTVRLTPRAITGRRVVPSPRT